MPRTGSASYIGSVVGDLQRNGSIISGGVNGTIGLDMNFTNGNFIGTMNLNDSNGAWASPRMSGEIDVNDADFRATSMSGVNRGDLRGNFYGPGAQEVGGAWNIENNNGENASGVFRAK